MNKKKYKKVLFDQPNDVLNCYFVFKMWKHDILLALTFLQAQ